MQSGFDVRLSDGDGAVEVDVLDGAKQLDAFRHRALERLAAADEAPALRRAC